MGRVVFEGDESGRLLIEGGLGWVEYLRAGDYDGGLDDSATPV